MEMSKQDRIKLIHFLNFVCDYEAGKPLEEMDEELIKSCVDVLLELQDKHVNHSPEFIDNQVRKIFRPEETVATAPETEKAPKKVVSKKKIWLVAACIAILVALFSIVSFSSERSVVDVLEDFFGTYEFIPFGKEVELGEETYGKGSASLIHNDIKELAKAEQTDLLLPKNELIERISTGSYKKQKDISIVFSKAPLSMEIIINKKLDDHIEDICTETIFVNNITYYICEMKDANHIQVYFEYSNNSYTLIHSDKDLLINILENMEIVKYED